MEQRYTQPNWLFQRTHLVRMQCLDDMLQLKIFGTEPLLIQVALKTNQRCKGLFYQ